MVQAQIELFTEEPTGGEADATARLDACPSSNLLVWEINQVVPPAIAALFTAMQDRGCHPIDAAEREVATRIPRALNSREFLGRLFDFLKMPINQPHLVASVVVVVRPPGRWKRIRFPVRCFDVLAPGGIRE
jgi:hypothetical protein